MDGWMDGWMDGCFSVTWVVARPVKILLGISWFVVDVVCSNLTCGSKVLQWLKNCVSFSSP